jgi:hypothetical protein
MGQEASCFLKLLQTMALRRKLSLTGWFGAGTWPFFFSTACFFGWGRLGLRVADLPVVRNEGVAPANPAF